MFRDPLVLPVAALAVGILLGHLWPIDPTLLAASSAPLLALAGLALFCKIRFGGLAACLVGFVFSGALLEIAHNSAQPPRLDVPDLAVTILDGCVVEPPALTGDRQQFLLELGPHVLARVSLFVHESDAQNTQSAPPPVRYGQRVEVEGRLRAIRNFGNPGAFDFRAYLAHQNIYWTISAPSATILPGACGNPFSRAIAAARTAALDRIATLYKGDRYNTAMMDAVLIGESSGLERVWTETYRSTGTFHALVISGSHVAVLAGFLLFLLRLCFIPRVPATLITVLAAWFYALITGWQAPVVRSAGGMTLFAIGSLFFRERRLLNLLAAVALFFLVLDPDQLFDPSFQLSFLAVAFLALFAVPLIEHISQPLAAAAVHLGDTGRDPRLPVAVSAHRVELRLYVATLTAVFRLPAAAARIVVCLTARLAVFVFDLFLTSAVIQAGLALPMALYFHRVSFSGLSANVIVVPLLGLVVPLGFIALFTGSGFVASLAALLLDLSRRTVDWHANLEPNWRIPAPPVLLSLLICAALAAAAIRWNRRISRVTAACALVALLAVLVWSPFAPHLRPGALELTAIDVGQGDSLFLAFPNGRTMLVDAGGIPTFRRQESPNPTPIRMDIGDDVVAPYLWRRGIRAIDVVAISHLHDDHVGGMPAILRDFHVGELWVGVTPECDIWSRIQAEAKRQGVRIRRLHRNDALPFGGASIRVLAPSTAYVPGAKPGNNDSLVMRVSYGARSILLTGDMEKEVEADPGESWETEASWPRADILKVGHHGSQTSSTPAFLDQVHPGVAIISDGYGNLYGHPHRATLEHLEERRILTLRTDRDGLVSVLTDGQKIWRGEDR